MQPFDAAGCAKEVAILVITYGVPVLKVVQWINKARKLWGGVRGILTAIKSGGAATELGAEGAAILGAILGVEGVKKQCF